jgi:alkanesulfonate monooxygenase SsuD/methylene tetrahydromethanopterin reductase-like flavin-dependent oxidoreductase (luciferase family)
LIRAQPGALGLSRRPDRVDAAAASVDRGGTSSWRAAMKVGIALNMLCQRGRSDASVVGEHLASGDLAEPLGFDSLFALEHHFTGYAMSPAPTQLLAYFAGRTRRIHLGTAVIVLPWHDPVRVAEQIALLDILSGGRCLFGFGRGAASVEYEGFRIPMGEARPRFVEAAKIIVQALSSDSFEYDGEFFHIPRTAIRPRPISHPERRFYASAVSPDSAEIMARLGFGVLMVMQNEWPKAAESIMEYRRIATAAGHRPRPPIILTNVCCAESRSEAHDRAVRYLGEKWQSIDDHYHFSDGHLATVKGYESYGKMAKTYAKISDSTEQRQKATDFYVKIQIVGTPKDCLEQIGELQRLTGLDHLVTEFSFGAMPHEEAEVNLRLFADRVLPILQRDPAFAGGGAPDLAPRPAEPARENLFAPA